MRVSFGIAPERMGALERAAVAHGVRAHRAAWDALLAREEVTLCCYCSAPPGRELHCHRVLAAGLFVKCGAIYMGER
jgi:predicted dehydrogenase